MMFGWRDEFDYFACGSCGCLQIETVPPDLGRYYPRDYYSFDVRVETPFKRLLKRQRARYLMGGAAPLGRVAAHLFGEPELFGWVRESGVRPEDPILDVGSGRGHLLLQFRDAGFSNLTGVDPYVDSDVAYEDGVRVLRQSIDEVEGAFALVMMHHSFEHVPDPLGVLREIGRLLVPRGQALIRIPLADSRAWQEYGRDWVQLDAPRHLFLHTARSMALMAQAAGLEIVRVIHDSTAFQFWGSEQYRRGIPLTAPRSYGVNPRAAPFTAADIGRWQDRAVELNSRGEGDQASFYLRRNGANSA